MSGQSGGSLRGKRIALVTHGSRGDVQPNVALALALKAAGAVVTFVALADHADFLARYGIDDFIPFKTTARELFELLKESLGGDDPESLARVRPRPRHAPHAHTPHTLSLYDAHLKIRALSTSCTRRLQHSRARRPHRKHTRPSTGTAPPTHPAMHLHFSSTILLCPTRCERTYLCQGLERTYLCPAILHRTSLHASNRPPLSMEG